MVGTILYKDFETGSYENIKLVAYEGTNYSDIGKGEFITCIVNCDTDYVDYIHRPAVIPDFAGMYNILRVAVKARKYLYKNTHITSVEFCSNYDECNFRPISFKSGVWEPVDFRTLFNNGGYYALVSEYAHKTPMWISVFCDSLNFCVQRAFGTSVALYGFSGYGIYMNIAVLPEKSLKIMGLPSAVFADAKAKDTNRLTYGIRKHDKCHVSMKLSPHPTERIIYLWNTLRLKCLQYFVDKQDKCRKCTDFTELIMHIADDEALVRFVDGFTAELSEYAQRFFDYGYIESKAHADVLTFREVLGLEFCSDIRSDISGIAKARSINSKFMYKLPCATYYDSNGTAFFKVPE